MECVGAVIALDDKTKNLNKKIEKIEQIITENRIENTEQDAKGTKNRANVALAYDENFTKEKDYHQNRCCMKKKFFKLIITLSMIIIAFGYYGLTFYEFLKLNIAF